jgi:hypothetical protein
MALLLLIFAFFSCGTTDNVLLRHHGQRRTDNERRTGLAPAVSLPGAAGVGVSAADSG